MLKTITKIGDAQGLVFDDALCELTGFKVGDRVNVTVHDGGKIVLTPIDKAKADVTAETMSNTILQVTKDYATTLRKLS